MMEGFQEAAVGWLRGMHPVWQALLAGGFTWGVTALGASAVFWCRNFPRRLLDAMMGFAAGVMMSASFWSLLKPAVEMAEEQDMVAWWPVTGGFLLGGLFLRVGDALLPHLHVGETKPEGLRSGWQRATLLVLAITLHNIPEGLAVGVGFGAAAPQADTAARTLGAAVALTIGIGLQNFPEGTSVSVPLRREGLSRGRSFWYGQLSGVVEPLAAVAGAAAAFYVRPILPYALSFAAGAMIYVVVEELIPESQRGGNADLATMGAIIGFTLMTFLDVSLG